MTNKALAAEIIDYIAECDPYGITTDIDDHDHATSDLAQNLDQCAAWLEEQAEEYDDDRARELLARVREN